MDKMKFETPDLTAENVAKIAELFPGVVTEGKVNIDLLRSMLGEEVFGDETYEFTWVGKRAAIAEAGRPIRKTLRPVIDDETIPMGADSTGAPYCSSGSRDWDTTENLYIEGDNLDVLKLLQESYLGKVKMIYIDPPYNTGNDSFVYKDDYGMSESEYDEGTATYDENGNLNFCPNLKSNPRFHSGWCSMLYPCLVLARNLLSKEGIIFISIDNNELVNTVKLGNEVFGEANYITTIANINNPKGRSDDKYFATAHEYIVVYKNEDVTIKGFEPEEKVLRRYNKKDDEGRSYRFIDLRKTGDSDKREDRPNMFYNFMYCESTKDFYPTFDEDTPEGYIKIFPTRSDGSFGRWRTGIDTAKDRLVDLCPVLMPKYNKWTVMEKDYLSNDLYVKSTSVWDFKDVNSERGTEQFVALGFDKDIFPRPKPLGTILRMLKLVTTSSDIILDFFSGSATTAHAVMKLNAEDGGNRKFIMVQLPEVTDEKSEAFKAGYKNICEIGKERIRRAGDKIKDEAGLAAQNLDIGFRVLKLDDTNMNDVYYAAGDYTQDMLPGMENNVKPDRTDMDLLFGCLLDWGLPLSMPHTHEEIGGFTVHTYNDGDLIACFDEHVSEAVIREIAGRKPLRAVFRDASFTSSPEKINVFEIFKLLAPNTNVRVI